jgi:DHA1 family tetracycline resistance protein-like MFS transporter
MAARLGSVLCRPGCAAKVSMSVRKPSLGVIFLTVLLDLLGFGLVMPFLALQARDTFGVDASVAALLGTTYSAMQFVFMPVWGKLSDRIGRRPVMLWSVLASALSMAALGGSLAFTSSVIWLFVTRALSGMATANIGTASAYIADITSPEERVKGMGMIGMAFGIGFVVGPGVGGVLSSIPLNGREGPWACFAAAALSLINFVWAWFSLPESLPQERRQRARADRTTRLEGLRLATQTPGIARAAVANFLIILAFSGLENTYALFTKDSFGLTQRQVGMLFVLMGVMGAGIQGGFMRRASGRYRETSLAFIGIVLQLGAFVGIVVSAAAGVWLLLIASAALSIGNGFTQPSLSAYVSRLADPARQGETLSGVQSLSSLGRVFGPLIAGQLYTFAPSAPFGGGAVILLLALLIALGMRGIQPATRAVSPSPALEG